MSTGGPSSSSSAAAPPPAKAARASGNFQGGWGGGAEGSAPQQLPSGARCGGDAAATLSKYFGFDAFREGQGGVVGACLEKKDVAVFWTTGSGKSLCYQVTVRASKRSRAAHVQHRKHTCSIALEAEEVVRLRSWGVASGSSCPSICSSRDPAALAPPRLRELHRGRLAAPRPYVSEAGAGIQ